MLFKKDADKESSADVPAKRRTIWQRLTGNKGRSGPSLTMKIAIGVAVLAILMVVVTSLYTNVPAGEEARVAINYPEKWDGVNPGWEVIKWIDGVVDWVVINWDPFFSAINTGVLRGILGPLEDLLLFGLEDVTSPSWVPIVWMVIVWLAGVLTWYLMRNWWAGLIVTACLGMLYIWVPWLLVITLVGLIGWRAVSKMFASIAVGFLVIMTILGLFKLAMMTLAITLTATLLCVVLGLPLGIIAAKSDRFEGFTRPILDGMQTMPSFVYLIPALMLFGLGGTPAVMATVIYAIPPIIRLTNLGIRQVAPSVIEAGRAFGATSWQMLRKVQIPLALPTILAGLNQTVMMALAMVVIASMIGAKGLGTEVLNGIARLEVGRGLIAGISIVFMAIILDRVSQGFAKRPESRPAT